MSYLAPYYDPDVFVSYSHGDPRERRAPLRNWTQVLIRRLQDQIRSLETEFEGLHLWMDPQIDPTANLTEELRKTVSASGVLMIVMSRHFLASSWCRNELEWFRKQIQCRTGESGRVFVVQAQETDPRLWPDFLRDERGNPMIGFPFYDRSSGLPFGWPDPREPNSDYTKELFRLQSVLVKRLRETRQRAVKRAQTAAPKQLGRRRLIYLHARPESESVRVDVGRALESGGITPIAVPSDSGSGLANWSREAKERIRMAKHCDALALLRANDSERFVDDLLGIGVNERMEMSDALGAPIPCAVLDKSDEVLAFDLASFGIERFDVNRAEWVGEFRRWLDSTRGTPLLGADSETWQRDNERRARPKADIAIGSLRSGAEQAEIIAKQPAKSAEVGAKEERRRREAEMEHEQRASPVATARPPVVDTPVKTAAKKSRRLKTRYYVSYAWSDASDRDREKLVDRFCVEAEQLGIKILRDKTSLAEGDRISKFMGNMGKADRGFIFLSDKYLKSEFCMSELFSLWQYSQQNEEKFLRRVRVFNVDRARIGDNIDPLDYVEYWINKHDKLKEKIDRIGWTHAGVQAQRRYNFIKKLAGDISELVRRLFEVLKLD